MIQQSQERIADIDAPGTWPTAALECVRQWATEWKGRTGYTTDIGISLELEPSFRRHFDGYKLRAFHFTRLLDHERGLISTQGLRPLTPDLVTDRINAALTFGTITEAEADMLRAAHVFSAGEEQHRAGQVCLVLSRNVFQSDPDSCTPLMRQWGGEAIHNSSRTSTLTKRLLALGTPCIVEAAIDICAQGEHLFFPALHKAFVGSFLNFDDAGADVFYRAPVPPEGVLGITTIKLD
jgi:hypothetical protein